jgi:hypothetical protein
MNDHDHSSSLYEITDETRHFVDTNPEEFRCINWKSARIEVDGHRDGLMMSQRCDAKSKSNHK